MKHIEWLCMICDHIMKALIVICMCKIHPPPPTGVNVVGIIKSACDEDQ